MMRYILIIILTIAPIGGIFAADIDSCGDPPPVADETLQGELSMQANLLLKFAGTTSLKGKIETSRKEIFSKYPDANRVVSDHYLLYQTCIFLIQDKTLSTSQKIDELKKIRKEFNDISVKKNLD